MTSKKTRDFKSVDPLLSLYKCLKLQNTMDQTHGPRASSRKNKEQKEDRL